MDKLGAIKTAVKRLSRLKYNRQARPMATDTGNIYHSHGAAKDRLEPIKGLLRIDASPVTFTRGMGYYTT